MSKLKHSWTFDAIGQAIGSVLGALKVSMFDGLGIALHSIQNALKVSLHDGSGNPLSGYRDPITGQWILNTHGADAHKRTVNRQFHRHSTPVTTIAIAVTSGDTSITVASSVGFIVGDYLHIQNGAQELIHPQIILIVGNVFTLDKPMDNSFIVGANVENAILNMNEAGTLASPLSYRIMPSATEIWHITKISIAMAHSSAGDLGKFGNLTALTNGMVLRRYDGLSGTFSSFTIWKNNGDIDLDTGTVEFPIRSGGGGDFGTTASGRLKQDTDSIAYLKGANGDYLELLGQDTLTGLGFFYAKGQGHFE